MNISYIFAILLINLLIVSQKGCLCTISCFTCNSRNGSDTDCEDPFHPEHSTYTEKCKVVKRGHIGEFPAHFCIKVIGTSYQTNEKLIIRRCVMENMDSQCGSFRLEEDVLHGCILTCDLDGCNASSSISLSHILLIPILLLTVKFCSSMRFCRLDCFLYEYLIQRHHCIPKKIELFQSSHCTDVDSLSQFISFNVKRKFHDCNNTPVYLHSLNVDG